MCRLSFHEVEDLITPNFLPLPPPPFPIQNKA